MDVGTSMTQFGPMWLLGMPFFREYYTSFDLGTQTRERKVFIAKADKDCQPEGACGVSGSKDERLNADAYRGDLNYLEFGTSVGATEAAHRRPNMKPRKI